MVPMVPVVDQQEGGPWALVPMAPMAPKGMEERGHDIGSVIPGAQGPWHPPLGGGNTAARVDLLQIY